MLSHAREHLRGSRGTEREPPGLETAYLPQERIYECAVFGRTAEKPQLESGDLEAGDAPGRDRDSRGDNIVRVVLVWPAGKGCVCAPGPVSSYSIKAGLRISNRIRDRIHQAFPPFLLGRAHFAPIALSDGCLARLTSLYA